MVSLYHYETLKIFAKGCLFLFKTVKFKGHNSKSKQFTMLYNAASLTLGMVYSVLYCINAVHIHVCNIKINKYHCQK